MKAGEAFDRALRAKIELSQERQRLEAAVAREKAMEQAIASLESNAQAALDEAEAADERNAELRAAAERLAPAPERVAAVDAKLAQAYERVSVLRRQLEDGIFNGLPDAALQRINRKQDATVLRIRELETERQELAELAAVAARLRSEADTWAAAAHASRALAVQRREEAKAVPEAAREMAVAEWEREQRLMALRPPNREQPPLQVMVSDGQLLHDVNSGQVYDLDGRPITRPLTVA